MLTIGTDHGQGQDPQAVESAISEDPYQKSNTAEVSLQTYLVVIIQGHTFLWLSSYVAKRSWQEIRTVTCQRLGKD